MNESILAFILFIFAFEILILEMLFERTSKRLKEIEELVERLLEEEKKGE
jgi:cell division protein FtsB